MKYYLLLFLLGYFQQISAQQKFTETRQGKALKDFYYSLQVETHWISGQHVNWETGEADKPDAAQDIHTHCSAFVAAACKKLNIYLLRPPEHSIQLLANAQCDWLLSSGAATLGWRAIDTGDVYFRAQQLADSGYVVIAVYRSKDPSKPGHIAFVRPAEITKDQIIESGPILIMAGTHNFNYISLKSGFGSHILNWPDKDILIFYHIVNI